MTSRAAWLLLALALLAGACASSDDDDADDDASGDDDSAGDDAADDDDSGDDDSGDDDTADDDSGDDDTAGPAEPVVFVQVTDVHQSRVSGTDKGRYENWFKSLAYVHDVIAPDFVVATGDLTDGHAKGQSQEEWDDYRSAVLDAGFTADDYHDLPGNHDCYDDGDFAFYLASGISGALRHAWDVERSGRRYAFVATKTARVGGIGGVFDFASLAWTTDAFEAAAGATHLFLFAHHNVLSPDVGLIGEGGLLDQYDVTAFVAGHTHVDGEWTDFGTRFIQTKNHYAGMPESDDGRMRLFVLTGETWAAKAAYVVDRGPVVIVTSPQDKRLAAARSPDAYEVSGVTEVTAMAFGEGDPSLALIVDDGAPVAMATDDGRTFTAAVDFGAVSSGAHALRVEDEGRVDDVNGVDEITVVSVPE